MDTKDSGIARTFGLKRDTWLRHANPWSVYTRIPIPCALALAVWSRDWIGWWSLLPVGLVAAWTAVNPTAFPPPRSLDHWASKAVLGERLWTNRKAVPIPSGHGRAPKVLATISALGIPPLVWGLVVLDVWMVLTGLALQMAGKNWFLDRMVWLYEDLQREPGGDTRSVGSIRPQRGATAAPHEALDGG